MGGVLTKTKVKETRELQTTRRAIGKYEEEKESLIKGIEREAEARLVGVNEAIKVADTLFERINKKICKDIDRYLEKFKNFSTSLSSIFGRVDKMMQQASEVKRRAEELINTLREREEQIESMQKNLSEMEKGIRQREQDLETKAEEIEEKHQEALQLADWAGRGETYTISRK